MKQIERIFDIIRYQRDHFPQPAALAGKYDGKWKEYSSQDVIDLAEKMSTAFLALGLKPGDKVANISNNRPEWNILDYALLQAGIIHVPIYPTITEEDYIYVLNHSEAKYTFVSSEDLYLKIKSIAHKTPLMDKLYTFDKVSGARHWTQVLDAADEARMPELQQIMDGIKAEDLATIIYTSGTTGNPKGVMLSHNNMVQNVIGSKPRVPVVAGQKCLSFLPLCHSFERMLTYLYTYVGINIYYAESIETIGDNLKEIKPHIFSTVPRLLEKVYDKIEAKGHALTGIKHKLFFWALGLANKYELDDSNPASYDIQLAIANKIIFSKWREALGGNVQFIVSGAAALQARLARIFWAAKIHVLEGYGLTETSPVISVNDYPGKRVGFGTVGVVLDNVELKLAEDGEICMKGPNMMLGYYKEPGKTAEVIDSEGWLHTGDIGTITEKGLLKITDRKKEIFKTSGGKYIAPQQTENMMKESVYIEQLMVVGEGKRFPSALITPAWENLEKFCKDNELVYSNREDMVKHSMVNNLFESECERFNERLGHWEQIKKFKLLTDEWSIEGKELTPTLKLKRKNILSKYAEEIAELYAKNEDE